MACGCTRRPRSVSEPEPRPSRPSRRKVNHTLILRIFYPLSYTDREVQDHIADWIQNYENTNRRIPSMFEINNEVIKTFTSDEKPHEFKNVATLIVDTTESQAMLWIMGESINEHLAYRNPDPPKEILKDSYINVISNIKCEICQNSLNGHKVKLKACGCVFHETCITKSYGYYQVCPVCSEGIDNYISEVVEIEIDPDGIEVIV